MGSRAKPDRRLEILAYIQDYHDSNRIAPTIREIVTALGFKTTSNVDFHLRKMREAGWIEYQDKKARSISILPAGEQILNRQSPTKPRKQTRTATYVNISAHFCSVERGSLLSVPVLGRTFGGPTGMVFSSDFTLPFFGPDSALNVYKEMLPRGVKPEDLFALHVQGPSMINAGINDGDYIILRKSVEANKGDMVVVWLDDSNETTLKFFFPENGQVRLEPANPDFKSIIIEPERLPNLRILGKVIQVVRSNDRD